MMKQVGEIKFESTILSPIPKQIHLAPVTKGHLHISHENDSIDKEDSAADFNK